jgi:GT2 family glycosyltransferase
MKAATFSLIVPTRRRAAKLRRFLDSVSATTMRLDEIEVVLVVDEDDEETIRFEYAGVDLKRVIVQPGLRMGGLNLAGYGAATGQYLMLTNDDAVLETPGWDEHALAAFRAFPDGVALVHVNDMVFEDKLCIFPFLSRRFCLLSGGICHQRYRRYRIDDHIHNIFDLLSLMGHHRRVFLPDVIFKHTNGERSENGALRYVPDDPEIHDADTRLFDSLLEDRKRIAVEALCQIEGRDYTQEHERWAAKLEVFNDSVGIRRPEHARWFVTAASSSLEVTRVTIGVVTADLNSPHAKECIDRVKTYTTNYELILLDNNRDPSFNHAREMNRLLSICATDYLLLMDDDVWVGPGWLEGLLRCVTPEVGVVTPLHRDRFGRLSYAGVVLRPDESGYHSHIMEPPDGPRRIQTLCSAAMLIHLRTCRNIRMDESYSKYFLDIDYGLQVWEAGLQVVCSPFSEVIHLAGATFGKGGPHADYVFEKQRRRYCDSWVDSGRIQRLRQGVWREIADFRCISDKNYEIDSLFGTVGNGDWDRFLQAAVNLVQSLAGYPALTEHVAQRARDALMGNASRLKDSSAAQLEFLQGMASEPSLIEEGFEGMNLLEVGITYCAIPQGEGAFSYERVIRGDFSHSFEADSGEALRSLVCWYKNAQVVGHVVDARLLPRLTKRSPSGS